MIHRLSPRLSLVVLAGALMIGCGGVTASHVQVQACEGCTFVIATTTSGAILTALLPVGGHSSTTTQTSGPADSLGIGAELTDSGAAFVYASDPGAAAIRAYTVSLSDGSLSPATPPTYPLGNAAGMPMQVVVANHVLYVAESGGFVASFAIQADGTLRAASGSPIAAGAGTSHLCVAGSSTAGTEYVFAGNSGDPAGSISAFTSDSSGHLTAVAGSPFAAGGAPEGLYCNSRTLYAALPAGAAVAGFSVAANGALTPLSGSPYAAGAGATSLTQYGQVLLAESSSPASLSALSIDSLTGALAAPGPPYTLPGAEGEIQFGIGGLFIPVAKAGLMAFTFDVTQGVFSPQPGSSLFPGSSPLVSTILSIPLVA